MKVFFLLEKFLNHKYIVYKKIFLLKDKLPHIQVLHKGAYMCVFEKCKVIHLFCIIYLMFASKNLLLPFKTHTYTVRRWDIGAKMIHNKKLCFMGNWASVFSLLLFLYFCIFILSLLSYSFLIDYFVFLTLILFATIHCFIWHNEWNFEGFIEWFKVLSP